MSLNNSRVKLPSTDWFKQILTFYMNTKLLKVKATQFLNYYLPLITLKKVKFYLKNDVTNYKEKIGHLPQLQI